MQVLVSRLIPAPLPTPVLLPTPVPLLTPVPEIPVPLTLAPAANN
jgi:hypothetical protein